MMATTRTMPQTQLRHSLLRIVYCLCSFVWLVNGQDCGLSAPIQIHYNDEVYLSFQVNARQGTFSMRIEYETEHSWIGVGVNLQDTGNMTPSIAIIGRVDETDPDYVWNPDSPHRGRAYRYMLNDKTTTASGVIPLPNDVHGQLKTSSFFQNAASQVFRQTALEFTHDLVFRNEDNYDDILYQISPATPANFIWAIGLPENQWEGGHILKGSFQLYMADDSCFSSVYVDGITPPPTAAATTWPPVTIFPTETVVGLTDDFVDTGLDNSTSSSTFSPSTGTTQTFGGGLAESFATTSPTSPNNNAPSPTFGTGLADSLSTAAPSTLPPVQTPVPVPTVVTDKNITNTTTTNDIDNNPNNNNNIEFGVDDLYADDDLLIDDLVATTAALQDPAQHLWMYHGILMGVAWGVFAPIGMFIPLLRKLDFLEYDDRWLRLHFVASITTVILSVVGFALAVLASSPSYNYTERGQEIEREQYFTGNIHVAMGVMIVAIMIVQAMMGCCIPSDKMKNEDDNDHKFWISEESDKTSQMQQGQNVGDDVQTEGQTSFKDEQQVKERPTLPGPIRTMLLNSKIVDEEGKLVPNRTAYKQYLPRRFLSKAEVRARTRMESTTVLAAALVEGQEGTKEVRVASLSPPKNAAADSDFEAIEVEAVDEAMMSQLKDLDTSHETIPTKVEVEDDDVSELEDPLSESETEEGGPPQRSDFLVCWIYTHRLLGVALFIVALYTCHTGIVLQSEIIDEEGITINPFWSKNNVLAIFWGVTGGIIAFMILLRLIYPRLCRKRPSPQEKKKRTKSKQESIRNSQETKPKQSSPISQKNSEEDSI